MARKMDLEFFMYICDGSILEYEALLQMPIRHLLVKMANFKNKNQTKT